MYDGYRVSIPMVKRPGRGVDHLSTSGAEVEERIELHLYLTILDRGLFYQHHKGSSQTIKLSFTYLRLKEDFFLTETTD